MSAFPDFSMSRETVPLSGFSSTVPGTNATIRDSATRRTSDRRATIELAGLPLGETADAITSGQAPDPQRRHPGPVHWAGLSHVRNQQVQDARGGPVDKRALIDRLIDDATATYAEAFKRLGDDE